MTSKENYKTSYFKREIEQGLKSEDAGAWDKDEFLIKARKRALREANQKK